MEILIAILAIAVMSYGLGWLSGHSAGYSLRGADELQRRLAPTTPAGPQAMEGE